MSRECQAGGWKKCKLKGCMKRTCGAEACNNLLVEHEATPHIRRGSAARA